MKIAIDPTKCTVCCDCINVCREEVLGILGGKIKAIKPDQCSICEDCMDICENNAIEVGND